MGSSSWNVASKMSFLTTPRQSTDELSNYLCLSLTEDEVSVLQTDGGIIDFWISKREQFPVLHRRALQIFVTPASSTPSERDFSLLKLLVTPHKNRMKDDIINATGIVRSALME